MHCPSLNPRRWCHFVAACMSNALKSPCEVACVVFGSKADQFGRGWMRGMTMCSSTECCHIIHNVLSWLMRWPSVAFSVISTLRDFTISPLKLEAHEGPHNVPLSGSWAMMKLQNLGLQKWLCHHRKAYHSPKSRLKDTASGCSVYCEIFKPRHFLLETSTKFLIGELQRFELARKV